MTPRSVLFPKTCLVATFVSFPSILYPNYYNPNHTKKKYSKGLQFAQRTLYACGKSLWKISVHPLPCVMCHQDMIL